jgi:hypothetical protein
MGALLLMLVIIFVFQGATIVERWFHILLIAVPLELQTFASFGVAYGACYAVGLPYEVAAPAGFIGSSNFFELAVSVAITVYGGGSGAAAATVVGVLTEVPTMLALVWFAKRTRRAVQRRAATEPLARWWAGVRARCCGAGSPPAPAPTASLLPGVAAYVDDVVRAVDAGAYAQLDAERRAQLDAVAACVGVALQRGDDDDAVVRLLFVCTHNAQVWTTVAAAYYGVGARVWAFSGGTEVTRVHAAVVRALRDAGFDVTVTADGNDNDPAQAQQPRYAVRYSADAPPITSATPSSWPTRCHPPPARRHHSARPRASWPCAPPPASSARACRRRARAASRCRTKTPRPPTGSTWSARCTRRACVPSPWRRSP